MFSKGFHSKALHDPISKQKVRRTNTNFKAENPFAVENSTKLNSNRFYSRPTLSSYFVRLPHAKLLVMFIYKILADSERGKWKASTENLNEW